MRKLLGGLGLVMLLLLLNGCNDVPSYTQADRDRDTRTASRVTDILIVVLVLGVVVIGKTGYDLLEKQKTSEPSAKDKLRKTVRERIVAEETVEEPEDNPGPSAAEVHDDEEQIEDGDQIGGKHGGK